MNKNKKPTMMEVKSAIGNIINKIVSVEVQVNKIDTALWSYIKYKKDDKEWMEFLKKEMDEIKNKETINESTDGKSIRNNQKASRGK